MLSARRRRVHISSFSTCEKRLQQLVVEIYLYVPAIVAVIIIVCPSRRYYSYTYARRYVLTLFRQDNNCCFIICAGGFGIFFREVNNIELSVVQHNNIILICNKQMFIPVNFIALQMQLVLEPFQKCISESMCTM